MRKRVGYSYLVSCSYSGGGVNLGVAHSYINRNTRISSYVDLEDLIKYLKSVNPELSDCKLVISVFTLLRSGRSLYV